MLKVIFPHSFDFGMPIARLVDVHSRGVDGDWMQKRAAVLTKEIADIKPEKDHTFIHLVTMGAGEYFGSNRNGDIFFEKSSMVYEFPDPKKGGHKTKTIAGGLIDSHKTFSKYAHAFRDHSNKDPDLKIGDIVAEAYNPEMHRGELIVKIRNNRFADGLEKLARGEDLPFSMSARLAYDICSICGNEAANRREYCEHLKNELTQIKESGHQVYAINPNPTFFDISYVFRPADRIAYGLQKVASNGTIMEVNTPSAIIAESWGIAAPRSVLADTSPRRIREKLAALECMAAMEKQIEGTGRAIDPDVDQGAVNDDDFDLSSNDVDKLRSSDFNSLMGALADQKICLPLDAFLRLVLGDKYDSVAGETESIKSLLPGVFSRMLSDGDGVEDVTGDETYDPATSLLPKEVRDVIEGMVPDLSLDESPVRRRVQITIIRGVKPDKELRKESRAQGMSKKAEYLAKQYASYQLAFVRAAEGASSDLVTGLTVLRNYKS